MDASVSDRVEIMKGISMRSKLFGQHSFAGSEILKLCSYLID